jgi:hypothetical protein
MKKTNKKIIILIFLIIISFFVFVLKESRNDISNTNIVLNHPKPNQYISSPLTIEGKARGNWFFEGDFPVILTNWDGLIIAESFASTKEDWMTEEFISFKGILEFEKPEYLNYGTLITSGLNYFSNFSLSPFLLHT